MRPRSITFQFALATSFARFGDSAPFLRRQPFIFVKSMHVLGQSLKVSTVGDDFTLARLTIAVRRFCCTRSDDVAMGNLDYYVPLGRESQRDSSEANGLNTLRNAWYTTLLVIGIEHGMFRTDHVIRVYL